MKGWEIKNYWLLCISTGNYHIHTFNSHTVTATTYRAGRLWTMDTDLARLVIL
jgi:hypothetical protein